MHMQLDHRCLLMADIIDIMDVELMDYSAE